MKNLKAELFKSLSLAVIVTSAATFAACSGGDGTVLDDSAIENQAKKTYTMTIQATKSNGTQTRGLELDDKTLNVKWNDGEKVYVLQYYTYGQWNHIGTLTATPDPTDPAKATLSGNLDDVINDYNKLRFVLHGSEANYTGQKGILLKTDGENSIEENYDYAYCEVESSDFSIDNAAMTVSVPNGITLNSVQAIVKFSLFHDDGSTPINATSFTINNSRKAVFERVDFRTDSPAYTSQDTGDLELTDLSGTTNQLYVAICSFPIGDIKLTATDASGTTYIYTKTGNPFSQGKYYEVKVKMHQALWEPTLSATLPDYSSTSIIPSSPETTQIWD